MSKGPKEADFDPGNLEDRTRQLLEEEFGDIEGGVARETDTRDEALLSGRPQISRDGVGEARSPMNLMPELKGLFKDRDYLIKEFFPQGMGDQIDTGLDGDASRNVKAKKIVEPEDIYDNQLDPRKERFLWLFLFGSLAQRGQQGKKTVGDEIAIRIKQLATGSGVPVVSYIRQKLWRFVSKRMTMVLPGAPKDRSDEDENKNSDTYRMLLLLLEDSVVQCVESIARTNECSNVTAFRYILKEIHDRDYAAFN